MLCVHRQGAGSKHPPMLERAGLRDLIQAALAQQIIWAPESHRPLGLEVLKALNWFPALFNTVVGEFQELGPGSHPEVARTQAGPDSQGQGNVSNEQRLSGTHPFFSFFS